MRPINRFLIQNNLRIATNPCVSPDFCLDWDTLSKQIHAGGGYKEWPKSTFETEAGRWSLLESERTGDCAWRLRQRAIGSEVGTLESRVGLPDGTVVFPATWENLLLLKNLVQEFDAGSTIFPTAGANLGRGTLGIGARFTTLHWPAVEWAMTALNLGVTANQNSIPRELVFDVDAMLEGRLDTVPFPFIGTSVPEGHQGQSVEGMSHGSVLSKLKTGFHLRRIAWSFNADHQPIGGKFDAREDALVRGCVLASYITFDLSPELAQTQVPTDPAAWVSTNVPAAIVQRVRARVVDVGRVLGDPPMNDADFAKLLAYVWPAMEKTKRRDDKYRAAREAAFTTAVGRTYLRELSIDELPGLTTPETTAAMLALCEALDMKISFVAPAFGFQKNAPYPDAAQLKSLIDRQWAVCRQFDASIGFHSGSGKSAENYRLMGKVTGQRLEVKTSGRYTYEMGVALSQSKNQSDAALWRDWYAFTRDMAVAGSFSNDPTEQKMSRSFVTTTMESVGRVISDPAQVFASPESCRAALEQLEPSPEHMLFFEYNFLYVLAADGKAEKTALGDHSPAGYRQRARFYAISEEARLNYAKNVASYIVFLADTTGLVPQARCEAARAKLSGYRSLDAMLSDI